MSRFVMAILLLAAVFGGWALYQHRASPLLSAQAIADRVGAVFGDGHPLVVRAIADNADGPGNYPMYRLTVRGHFRFENRTARYLEYSALRNRWFAWGIWATQTPPGRGAHVLWTVNTVPLQPNQAATP